MGTGPWGHAPRGRFNVDLDLERLAYAEPSPRRIRARLAGETVLDSTRGMILYRHGQLARYYFPREDWRWESLGELVPVAAPQDAPGLEGHVTFAFGDMDAWLEEDDEIVGHAIDPYHRVDVRDSSRHVRVSLDGELLAESTRAKALFETSLPTRWYFPPQDLVAELAPSDLQTICAYKGRASYRSHAAAGDAGRNIAWYYAEPLEDAARVGGHVAFFNERVDLELDGELVTRPRPGSPWSRPDWWLHPPER